MLRQLPTFNAEPCEAREALFEEDMIMRHKWFAWVVIAALIDTTALAGTLVAKTPGDRVRLALGKMESGPQSRVFVTLRNKNTVTGYLDGVDDLSFFVTDPVTHASTQVAYSNVRQFYALSTGAKVAIWVGVTAGVIIATWLSGRVGGV